MGLLERAEVIESVQNFPALIPEEGLNTVC
jgi:hypothetical protein